jgi:class 3 adenylate cyclase
MICPRCQTNNPQAARFCMNCGLELVRRCSNCQSELPHGARFCMACGQPVLVETPIDASRLSRLTASAPETLVQKIRSTKAARFTPAPGSLGEQRTITTLMLDVVGSTVLSTQLGVQAWTEIIDRAFELIAPIIYRYEGTIVRTLGDSLLAFFGAPVAHEDDPQRAVRAGLEIITHMRDYSQVLKNRHAIDYAMRACINTGSVVIGPVGDDLTYDYSAESGTVNLTSRIKFASQTMGVLVSANTYRFIAPYFECDNLGPLEVKGLTTPLEVYQVKATRLVPSQARGFRDIASPMVGRERELETLNHLCEAVRAGLGRAALILGEPGLGKTRLIQEWQKEVRGSEAPPHLDPPERKSSCGWWVTGRCSAYSQAVAYQLIINVLRNLIGVSVGSDEPLTRAALYNLAGELLGDEMMEVYPYLGRLLSVKLEREAEEKANISDPQALQTMYLEAIQRLFLACMKNNPLILILEDLHWADSTSTELFIKLLPLISSGPILFCLVSRPERNTAGWRLVEAARQQLGGSLTEITLNALNEKDSRILVANLLELESLPRRVRELILRKAEGNPYFVEEVVRMLIERGTIVNQNGAWVAQKEISDHEVPDNLQGLLLARIDRLPAEARYTLLVASVIGRIFPIRVLSEVMGEV